MIRLESLNVGEAKALVIGDEVAQSGIGKTPTQFADLGPDGFTGDAQADLKNHGGPDQAVYLYRTEDYAWWNEELNKTLALGIFGENLSVSGLPETVRIGDRLAFGEVLLEVTAARIPCSKLAAKMNDVHFVKTFTEAGRPGFYARVLQQGCVAVGDPAEYTPNPDAAPSVLETFRWFLEPNPDSKKLKAAFGAPLATRLRKRFEEKLSAER